MGLSAWAAWGAALVLLLASVTADAQRGRSRIPTAAVISPDASRVAAQDSGTILIWDRSSGKRLASFKSEGMFRGALGLDALAGIVADERIALWRGPSFKKVHDLPHAPKVLSLGRVYLSGNGRTLCTVFAKDGGVGDPNAVAVWDGASGKLQAQITLERGRIQGVALSPDGGTVAVFGDEPGARNAALLEVHRLAPRTKLRTLALLRWRGPDRTTYAAAFSPDGKRLALGAGTRLLLFDVASLPSSKLLGGVETDAVKVLFPPPLRGPRVALTGAHQIAFALDGKRLSTLHAFGVVGAAIWEISPAPARRSKAARPRELFRPLRWVKRPMQGTLRQLAFDAKGDLWLITASYAPDVWVFRARGDQFQLERTLTP